MNEVHVIELTRQATQVGFMLTLPILSIALFTGLLVSLFQAMTQIQEMTLTYLPKLVGAAAVMIGLGSWMLQTIVGFTQLCFEQATRIGSL